ncbi:hypothetical protein A9K55_004932 [Cordyceps militaris]|uniref:Uncharacterized protein n=1 Tax=Cordyceps militaris TaxID=73501 RepID=A0A2H4SLP4_CORMI|nr:hypothetical protein A9K55_004932 [Cordyceps militaris]
MTWRLMLGASLFNNSDIYDERKEELMYIPEGKSVQDVISAYLKQMYIMIKRNCFAKCSDFCLPKITCHPRKITIRRQYKLCH